MSNDESSKKSLEPTLVVAPKSVQRRPRSVAKIGEILIRKGYARHDQIDILLALQRQYTAAGRSIALGDLCISHRVLSSLEVTEALFIQEEGSPESVEGFISAIRFVPT